MRECPVKTLEGLYTDSKRYPIDDTLHLQQLRDWATEHMLTTDLYSTQRLRIVLFHLGVGSQIGFETEGINRWDEGFHCVKRRPRLRCILHDERGAEGRGEETK